MIKILLRAQGFSAEVGKPTKSARDQIIIAPTVKYNKGPGFTEK